MDKQTAIKEARIGALMQGGTWYVTRRGDKYGCVHSDRYNSTRHGRIAEMFDAKKVRTTTPPTVH